ncbi:unnamed protein product [Nippostrongylus brasiliensis]|uniref:Uncharacterized protein n=1 Tax=Nippostrongylus brasiliensis TaxID=27835 RepID=A0A0N4XQZ0_NIPBR|nr:unnamed protein product [Nippostrongylus brasiliensis]
MQPILSSTGGCFADLSTSSFSALPSLPPSEQFNNEASISRSSAGGVHTKLSEYLLTGAYSGAKSLQQQKSMFDAAASSTSCSPPLTPPALDLLKPGMRGRVFAPFRFGMLFDMVIDTLLELSFHSTGKYVFGSNLQVKLPRVPAEHLTSF